MLINPRRVSILRCAKKNWDFIVVVVGNVHFEVQNVVEKSLSRNYEVESKYKYCYSEILIR